MVRLISVVGLAVALGACGPQFRAEVVGRASVFGPVAAGPQNPVRAEVAFGPSTDAEVLHYVVSLPRALELAYQATCPTAERHGTLGETFEHYRARRLAELERDRRATAGLIGAAVGAALPSVSAGADVRAPGASATARAEVRPGDVAGAAAMEALPEAQLPPGDTGAQVLRGQIELGSNGGGRCMIAVWSELPEQDTTGVRLDVTLTQIIDIEAHARQEQLARDAQQVDLARKQRATMMIALQHAGADPLARARRRAAEEEDRRRRQAAADQARAAAEEEQRRRQAAIDEERRRKQAVIDEENRRKQAVADQARMAADEERRRKQAIIDEDRRRRELVAEQARMAADEERRRKQAAVDAERIRREMAAEAAREAADTERRRLEQQQLEWSLRLRADVLARLLRLGADPEYRRRMEEARLRAHWEEQRRLYTEKQAAEERARMDVTWALSLRGRLLAQLLARGADPDFRRKRDEAEIRAFEEEQRRLAQSKREAEARVELAMREALDARVTLKLQLRQMGAVDRPPPPPPQAESPPPPPYAGAVWIDGRQIWNGIAWVWQTGHYARPPAVGTIWIPPTNITISGTLVVRPGAWVSIRAGTPPR